MHEDLKNDDSPPSPASPMASSPFSAALAKKFKELGIVPRLLRWAEETELREMGITTMELWEVRQYRAMLDNQGGSSSSSSASPSASPPVLSPLREAPSSLLSPVRSSGASTGAVPNLANFPKFQIEGSLHGGNPRKHLHTLETIFSVCNTDPSRWTAVLLFTLLETHAATWATHTLHPGLKWEHAKEIFIAAFTDENERSKDLRAFQDLCQTSSVAAYAAQFLDLVQKLELDEAAVDVITKFAMGLGEHLRPLFCAVNTIRPYPDLQSAIRAAKDLETNMVVGPAESSRSSSVKRPEMERRPMVSAVYKRGRGATCPRLGHESHTVDQCWSGRSAGRAGAVAKPTHPTPSRVQQSATPGRGTPAPTRVGDRCRGCGELGHWQRDCPKRRA